VVRGYLRAAPTEPAKVCRACCRAAIYERRVPAGPVRAHILSLKALGVGAYTLADASDVSRPAICAIAAGEQETVRASTARRILECDDGALDNYSLVPVARALDLLRRLKSMGQKDRQIGAALGVGKPTLFWAKGFRNRKRVRYETVIKLQRFLSALED